MEIKNIQTRVSHSFRWISLESLAYQGLLLIHQIMLCKVAGYKLYGKIGALFSVVYLMVTIANFGLESSLSPFFKKITKNKRRFRSFFLIQSIPTIALSLFIGVVAIMLKSYNYKITSFIGYDLICILFLLILSECIKKTVRSILHFSFRNKINAYIETGYIISYISVVWTYYMLTHTITLYAIFIPMLLMSFVSSVILGFFAFSFYRQIPDTTKKTDINFALPALKCRFFNFLNQWSHSIFSGNFLVPFFAMQFGLAHAGVFKLINHISYGITSLLRKIFGWTSDITLSATKDLSIAAKRQIFEVITQRLYHFLYVIIIFLAINLHKIVASSQNGTSSINWPLILFFLVITLSENLLITYEKFYIAEEKNHYILLFNLFTIGSFAAIISLSPYVSQLFLLLAIASIRIVTFTLLSIISFYTWSIRPKLAVNPAYIAASLIISALFFAIF